MFPEEFLKQELIFIYLLVLKSYNLDQITYLIKVQFSISS